MKHTIAALQLDNICFSYGAKPVLDAVTFEVPRGQCTLLLGPNAAGKSTLFSLVTRLYHPSSGQIFIEGHLLAKQSSLALSRLGVVFQQPTLDTDLTVDQNLRYHGALYGLSNRDVAKRIDEELERQGLQSRRHEKVKFLNGGHRRRVEIARALLHHPRLLLLDEPTAGLDIPSRSALVEHVHALCNRDGIAVLWATHLLDEVKANDHLVILHQGLVRAKGDVSTLKNLTNTASLEAAFAVITQAGN